MRLLLGRALVQHLSEGLRHTSFLRTSKHCGDDFCCPGSLQHRYCLEFQVPPDPILMFHEQSEEP